MISNEYSLIIVIALTSLAPFIVAGGTCYIKFSVVFVLLRNALGIQQVPSNMTLNGIAMFLTLFVMTPVIHKCYDEYVDQKVQMNNFDSLVEFGSTGLSGYRNYLKKYSDPDLLQFFEKAQANQLGEERADNAAVTDDPSIIALLPAYALSEVKSAFKIGFYLYLPFIVVDMVISCVLLALGMMMMSPVTISVPIKLILFVAMDGWSLLSKGLVMQYIDLAKS